MNNLRGGHRRLTRRRPPPYAVAPGEPQVKRRSLARVLIILAGLAATSLTVVAYAAWRIAGMGPP